MNKRLIRKRGIAVLFAAMIMSTSTGCSIADLPPLLGTDEPQFGSDDSEGQTIDVSKLLDPLLGKKSSTESEPDDSHGAGTGTGTESGGGSSPMTNPFGGFGNDDEEDEDSSDGYMAHNDDEDSYEKPDDYDYEDKDEDNRAALDDGFTIGRFKGDEYINEFFGIKISTPAGYEFGSEKELEEESGYPMEYHNDDRLAKQVLDEGEAMIVAYGADSTGLNFFDVAIQESEEIASSVFEEEDILKIAKISLQKSLQDGGAEVYSIEIEQKIVADEVHYVLVAHGSYEGYDFYEQMVNIQKGDYMMSIVINNFITDKTDAVLDSIEKIY